MISRKCDAEMLHSSRKVNFHTPQSLVHANFGFEMRWRTTETCIHTSVNHRSNQKIRKLRLLHCWWP